MRVELEKLDHVALWVSGRDSLASRRSRPPSSAIRSSIPPPDGVTAIATRVGGPRRTAWSRASRTSRQDISSGRRGGLRSGRGGPRGRTKEQLYNEAKRFGIKGRSRMNKRQLPAAVNRKKS